MAYLLVPDRAIELAPRHRSRVVELVAAVFRAAEVVRLDEEDRVPEIEGRDDFEIAPFHVWARLRTSRPLDDELEADDEDEPEVDELFWWPVPLLDVAGAIDGGRHEPEDGQSLGRPGNDCADAQELTFEDDLWLEEYDTPFIPEDPFAIREDARAAWLAHPSFDMKVRAGAIVIELHDDEGDNLPVDLAPVLVEIVHDLTTFRFAGKIAESDGEDDEDEDHEDDDEDVALSEALERLQSACWPEPEPMPQEESARRLSRALVEAGALEATDLEPIAAILKRALAGDASVAEELLACPSVTELFADDATLAEWLAAW